MSPLTNKELCSLAFECEAPSYFPLVNWNVTFPDKPKPTPQPPQPPTVNGFKKKALRKIFFYHFSPDHQD
jgi:hypothetical protein